MAEQNQEYDQYAPQTSGRLFSSAMFGFNKEEVLEYLEELADENFQRQDAAELKIQELNQHIQHLEATDKGNTANADADTELISLRSQLQEATRELDIARAATQQTTEDLQQHKQQTIDIQQENTWLREEYQKSDQQITELRTQLNSTSQGQLNASQDATQQQNSALQQRLTETLASLDVLHAANEELAVANEELATSNEELVVANEELTTANDELASEQEWNEDGSPATLTATAIVEEAHAQAERIREEAYAERDRIHRQLRSSAGGLTESITNLRTDISGVEGEVGEILEAMQIALAEILSSLGRTEQNLSTLGVQVDRFPSAAPPVPRPQQVVYFQPSQQPLQHQNQRNAPQPNPQNPPSQMRAQYTAAPTQQSYTNPGFRRVWPEDSSQPRSFSPSYSSNSTQQTAEAYQPMLQEEPSQDERLRNLSESLVETLRQLMN